jgi:hypothetical protein
MGVVGSGEMHNGVQPIAYADRFGGSLAALREVLDGPLAGLFCGVHILPFFTPFDGADAGFDPVDHTEVDSRLGSWDDVRAMARDYVRPEPDEPGGQGLPGSGADHARGGWRFDGAP